MFEHYRLTTFCGFSCSSPRIPQSGYEWLRAHGRTSLDWNWLGLSRPPPLTAKLQHCNESGTLEAMFPNYSHDCLNDVVRLGSAPLVRHLQSESSFASSSQPLPEDWLVYVIDLCRDRLLWFASTDDGHLIGIMLLKNSDTWDDGFIFKWELARSPPEPVAHSWWHFLALASRRVSIFNGVPAGGWYDPPRLLEWSNSIAVRAPSPKPNSPVPTAGEEYRYRLLDNFVKGAITTMVSAYLPGCPLLSVDGDDD